MNRLRLFGDIYRGRRVLITGHTGFKGAWLTAWLLDLGAEVAGFSVDVPTSPAMFDVLCLGRRIRDYRGDVGHGGALEKVFHEFRPEIVFHLAAQSLVRESYRKPVETFTTNVLGTVNVMESIRHCDSVRAAVMITSDKCYRNQEWEWGYRETDILGGDDPYSASKACAETAIYSYMRAFLNDEDTPRIATARAGNVIGGGDWAKDRVVPDCVRSWASGRTVMLRHPQATRPWQHVLEPLSGYLWLGSRLWMKEDSVSHESFNFGPDAEVVCSVRDLVEMLARSWPGSQWSTGKGSGMEMPEATLLKLCCDKALARLGWRAVLSLGETVAMTGDWYFAWFEDADSLRMYELTMRQIEQYGQYAAERSLPWAVT